jgi:GNAT superfamily N-acetyltransferase
LWWLGLMAFLLLKRIPRQVGSPGYSLMLADELLDEAPTKDRSIDYAAIERFYAEEITLLGGSVASTIEYTTLAIAPGYQRMGVGRAFCQWSIRRSEQEGVPLVADASRKGILQPCSITSSLTLLTVVFHNMYQALPLSRLPHYGHHHLTDEDCADGGRQRPRSQRAAAAARHACDPVYAGLPQ